MATKVLTGPRQYILEFWYEHTKIPPASDCQLMAMERNGKLAACVLWDNYNGASISMHVLTLPGVQWSREFLFGVFAYPFLQLKVNKVHGPISSKNEAAKRFAIDVGGVLGATLKDAHPDGDLLVYEMHRRDCRWLNILKKVPQHGKELSSAAT